MKISFIGAGNLASHMAIALTEATHQIVGICTRTAASGEVLAKRIGLGREHTTTNLSELNAAEAYIIAVPDEQLPIVVSSWPERLKGGVVIHTSGSTNVNVLCSLSENYGVLYPMQTFSKDKNLDFKSIPCFIEGSNEKVLTILERLAASVSRNVSQLASPERLLLHVAAVMACNFSNYLYTLAFDILDRHGIDPTCLLPLIDETAEKVHRLHPRDAQTGPARRGDVTTIRKHLYSLSKEPEGRALSSIYQIITQSILHSYISEE